MAAPGSYAVAGGSSFSAGSAASAVGLTAGEFYRQPYYADPGLGIFIPGYTNPTAPTPTPTPTPTPGATSAPGAAATRNPALDLQVAINALPIAVGGQVITVEYHNALRTAVIAIAQLLGASPVAQTQTLTLSPAFLPLDGTNWSINNFSAVKPAGSTGAVDGWLPVPFFEGGRIQGMTVFGRRDGNTTGFSARLFRQLVRAQAGTPAPAPVELIALDLNTAGNPFQLSASIVAGATGAAGASLVAAAQAEEFKIIDTDSYKYFVRAGLTTSDAGATAQIDAIQITIAKS